MPLTVKHRIQRRFRRALPTYDQQAVVQNQMADNLIELTQHLGRSFPSILEIGCGTGLLTRKIVEQFSFQTLYANDLIAETEPLIRGSVSPDIRFIPGDAETVVFPSGLDLIISNATFQWFDSLELFFPRVKACLNPSGILAFSIFGPDNLWELAAVSGNQLRYLEFEELQKICRKHSDLFYSRKDRHVLHFADFRSLLAHLKATGVNGLKPSMNSNTQLKALERRYTEKFQTPEGLPLTYHPMYFVVRNCPDPLGGK